MMKYSEFKEEAEANDYPEESTPLFIVDERSVKSVLQLDRIFKEGTKTNARKRANEKYDFVSRPRAYTDKKDNWPKEFDFICRGLMSHLGPPLHKDTLVQLPPFNSTDLVSLSIMAWPGAGIDLFRKTRQVIHIADLVRNNTGLETIELGFTGLSDVGLTQIIDPLSNLPKLTFLDLKGNRLTQQAVDMFTQMLKDEAKFPSILWIDLRNNIDILTLPNIYLDAISKRWPTPNDTDEQTVQLPTHRELAEGQVIVKDGQFETVT
ncbi:unnamed protein product [Owenia fusiformis]|uniref:Uncharacterized protein n=1 Tax=Owenia fusiformis TaxID=6347 RepID=A0A8S4PLL1_OWEFU|nr:unnamed protein product [Owenia fusiformis]